MASDGRLLQMCIEVAGGAATVSVRGEVDIATIAEFEGGLARAISTGPSRLVVDLTDTGFIDGSGMGAIARASRQAPDCQIVLRSPSPVARRMIELTEIDRICLVDG